MIYSNGLYRLRKKIEQSNLLVISDIPKSLTVAINSVVNNRIKLKWYISRHPEYLYSLEPVKIDECAPSIVRTAAYAAETANVGPMAVIPGALAELAVRDMVLSGSQVNLVENGGEISASSNRSINVGIYAGNSPLSGRIGFHLTEDDFPIGIATSSATVSHALNFGEADAAIVVADSASLADAAAKATCNAVKGSDIEASVQSGLEVAENIPGIRAAFIIRECYAGSTGKLPKLVKFNGELDEFFEASLHDVLPYNARPL